MKTPRIALTGAVLALTLAFAACSPALNWRSVAVPEAALQVMLPCKPENAVRTVELAGAPLALALLGCDADGATFAVSYASLADPSRAGVALDHWRAATLARIGVLPQPASASPAQQPASAGNDSNTTPGTAVSFVPAGALALPQSVRATVQGRRPDGSAVTAHAVWFARALGNEVRVYHAVMFSDKPRPAVADSFFAGLELQ